MEGNGSNTLDVAGAVQGKVTGLIIPPPDIRAVIDKTATFVARNGTSFEQKIMNSAEGKTPKFNFMRPYDPYHAYYEYKIREVEEGRESSLPVVGKPITQAEPKKTSSVIASTKASFVSPIARYASVKLTEAPPQFEFIIAHPSGLTAVDFDVIRLTAQYTAVNGRDFLTGVVQREQRNPQFDFLKPTHMLFNYFTSLVDAYSKILYPHQDQLRRLSNLSNTSLALQDTVQRWEWNRSENEKKKNSEAAADAEKEAYYSIDWFDFVVVETIDFDVNELLDSSLVKPTPIPGLSTNVVGSVPPPPPPRPAASVKSLDNDADMDVDMDDDDIKVVNNYVPRTAQTSATSNMMMVDPISGKAIPAEKMEDHMRIQLQDPAWRQQQKRFQEKQQETGYAEGSSIAESLKILAKKRNDIFGGESGTKSVENEDEPSTVQWDGHQSSINLALQMKNDINARRAPEASVPPPPKNLVGPTDSYPTMPSVPMLSVPMPTYIPPVAPIYSQPMAPSVPPMPVVMSASIPNWYPQQTFQPQAVDFSSVKHIPLVAPPPELEETQTLESTLIPESEFAAKFPNPITVTVIVPVDSSATSVAWGLNGQSLNITTPVMASCKDLKEQLSSQLGGMPANKQQLKLKIQGPYSNAGYFLKDSSTLAAMNVGNLAFLELSVRSRGGKR